MRLRCGWLLVLVALSVVPPAKGEEKADRVGPKYDGVYLTDFPTVFVYVPESSELQFGVEPDEKGRYTGLRREFRMDGVPHRIAITVTDGRIESVAWDDRPLEPTTLTRQEINDIRRAAEIVETNRNYVADPESTDEERLGALYTIGTVLKERPFLAMGDEPESLIRYHVRAFESVQLQLLNTPVEVQVSLVDAQGMLLPTLRKEFEGGHTLEAHCSEVQVGQVRWNGKPVLPGYPHREYYILPPKSISVVGLFVDGGSFNFQRRENGEMQLVRLNGKVLHAREKRSEPYYLAEDFSTPELLDPKGKLITVFNVGLPTAKPARKPEAKLAEKKSDKLEPEKKVPVAPTSSEAAARTWTDSSGKFSVQAKLLEIRDGRVVLQRTDGKNVEVPVSRLSTSDQRYLENLPQLPSTR